LRRYSNTKFIRQMDIRGSDLIEIFYKKHADVFEPLANWVNFVEKDIENI